ncbi:hypothetical protein STEG23_037474 [Scotinomys teguina]
MIKLVGTHELWTNRLHGTGLGPLHSRGWTEVHKCTRAKEQKNSNYVGTTDIEGVEAALSKADMENTGKDKTKRNKVGYTGHNNVDAHNNNLQFIGISAGAGELEQRKNVTEVVVDGVGITEGELEQRRNITEVVVDGVRITEVIIPKILMNFLVKKNVISYTGCMTQLYFSCFFGISECYMLTSMAYDHYVAICNPLLYNTAMSPKVCFYLMLGSYLMGFSGAMIHTGFMLQLTFCDGNTINHYFCDLLPLLQLSCSSTYANEVELFVVVGKDIVVTTSIILTSYGFILCTMFQVRSTESKYKAFSTCSSHLFAVSLLFGSSTFMYLQPSSPGSLNEGKISSICYAILVPMMNPLIYSLRNKDVKVDNVLIRVGFNH